MNYCNSICRPFFDGSNFYYMEKIYKKQKRPREWIKIIIIIIITIITIGQRLDHMQLLSLVVLYYCNATNIMSRNAPPYYWHDMKIGKQVI